MTPTLADCLARKDNDLAAVRILAATAVLWAHAWVVTVPGIKNANFLHIFAFSLDWHGVHAFFILSGLLLTRSFMDRPDIVRFIVARLMRYIPGIFVSAAIVGFVVGPWLADQPLGAYFGSGAPFRFVALVTTLLDVNATLPGVLDKGAEPNTLYIPLWTIHYELVFAVCLAIAGALGMVGRRWLTLAALVVTLGFNVVWFWNGDGHPELGSPHHLVRFATTFGLGIALAVFADRVKVSKTWGAVAVLVAIPLAFSPVAALAGMLLLAYVILCIGFAALPLAAPLARLGAWSYGFYVSGFVIEQGIVRAAPGLDGWGVFLVALPLALAAGALSWRYVEQPCLRWSTPVARAIRRRLPWSPNAAGAAEAAPERPR